MARALGASDMVVTGLRRRRGSAPDFPATLDEPFTARKGWACLTRSDRYVQLSVRREVYAVTIMNTRLAKFAIGQIVRHRIFPFRGVIFDVDPLFNNTEEWWNSIPEAIRPRKDQPFYHLLAENDQNTYVAYVSEQNLLPDDTGEPVGHPHTALIFDGFQDGHYNMRPRVSH
jgi:heat shock protein HspQ